MKCLPMSANKYMPIVSMEWILVCGMHRFFLNNPFIFCFFRTEFIKLAAEYKPLNLGQGFPDFAPPKFVTDALSQTCSEDSAHLHQYTRGFVAILFIQIKIFNLN